MQHSKKTIWQKCGIGLTGIAWVAGLLIAGSDSPYMPWLNGMGVGLFLGAALLLGKFLHPLRSVSGNGPAPKAPEKTNTRIKPRYALGI